MLLVMRMTFLLSMIGLMQISASVYSQAKKISLNLESVTVGKIMDEIKEQSEFNFLYRSDLFDEMAPIDIKFVNASIEDILNEVLVLNGFEYEIDDNVVIIRKEKETVPEMVPKEETKRTITGKITRLKSPKMLGYLFFLMSVILPGKLKLVALLPLMLIWKQKLEHLRRCWLLVMEQSEGET